MENELKLEIQEKVKSILEETAWLENTPETREKIKSKIDDYLLELSKDYTIHNYFSKVTESEGVDVYIEHEKGEGIYINHYDIIKTSEIQKGGFN